MCEQFRVGDPVTVNENGPPAEHGHEGVITCIRDDEASATLHMTSGRWEGKLIHYRLKSLSKTGTDLEPAHVSEKRTYVVNGHWLAKKLGISIHFNDELLISHSLPGDTVRIIVERKNNGN